MLHLEQTPYGFLMTLSGPISHEVLAEVPMELVAKAPLGLKILLDLTKLGPMFNRKAMTSLLSIFIEQGLQRVCVLYSNPLLYLRLSNIFYSLKFKDLRFINVTKVTGYHRVSREWLIG